MEENLVYIDDYGLLGSNFYWHKYEAKGISKEEILAVGLISDRVQVHRKVIGKLVEIDRVLQGQHLRLYIKEGFRSEALYRLVYRKRVASSGQEEADRLFNMEDMPHASGYSVDVAIWDPRVDKEVYLRRGADGTDALFVDFYKEREDPEGRRYQELQETLIRLMQDHGFRLGVKREYFHFDFRPDEPRNY